MSKTLWVNFLSFVAIAVQVITGKELFSPEYQALALTIVNAVLRAVTNSNLVINKEIQ